MTQSANDRTVKGFKPGMSNVRPGGQNQPGKDSIPGCWTALENVKEGKAFTLLQLLRLIKTSPMAILLINYKEKGIKYADKLYSDRKGRFPGSAYLRLKWAVKWVDLQTMHPVCDLNTYCNPQEAFLCFGSVLLATSWWFQLILYTP